MDSLDVDDKRSLIIKVVGAQHHAQLLPTFLLVAFLANGQLIRVYSCRHNETTCQIKETQWDICC